MRKYIVGRKQKHIIVSEDTHTAIKMYAMEQGLTIVEATYELLRLAFNKVYNLESSKNNIS